jgi:hypothetical protein
MATTVEGFKVFDEFFPDFADRPRLMSKGVVDGSNLSPSAVDTVAFPSKYPRHSLRMSFKFSDTNLNSANDLHKLIGTFGRRGGRHEAFWIPSYVEELSPAGDASGTSLNIKEVEYDATYLQATSEITRLGNYIWLLDRDGTVDYRKVTAASTGDPETLTVSSAFSKTFTQGEFICGFLYFVRFLSDELIIDFSKRGIAEAKLGFIEVYDVTSEADA